MYYLKLKNCSYSARWSYYQSLGDLPAGGYYMCVGLKKYAQEFDTVEDAQEELDDWDDFDSFKIVDKEDHNVS